MHCMNVGTTHKTGYKTGYNESNGGTVTCPPLHKKQTNMKNKLEIIRNSWTWNNKMFILTLSLIAAHIYPFIENTNVQAETIVYQAPQILDTSIEMKLQERARELYKENEKMDLERYRLEAIRELNNELLSMMDESPFIDYDEMAKTYGY